MFNANATQITRQFIIFLLDLPNTNFIANKQKARSLLPCYCQILCLHNVGRRSERCRSLLRGGTRRSGSHATARVTGGRYALRGRTLVLGRRDVLTSAFRLRPVRFGPRTSGKNNFTVHVIVSTTLCGNFLTTVKWSFAVKWRRVAFDTGSYVCWTYFSGSNILVRAFCIA